MTTSRPDSRGSDSRHAESRHAEPLRPDLDLTVSRIIGAPRAAVWNAWTDAASFEQWWVPAPAVCRVREMDLRPGGSFRTELSSDGVEFGPHITGCFLAVDELERIVFTDALVAGWRPSAASFVTAVITMKDHPDGTEYNATALHRDVADRDKHEQFGFHDGWGTVTRQLAELVESRSRQHARQHARQQARQQAGRTP